MSETRRMAGCTHPPDGDLPFRVVITGGPCSGKTSLWERLGQRCPGAVPVPETATELILSGLTPKKMGPEAFQRRVFQRQLNAEAAALEQGVFLLCDRGLADGQAYFPALFSSLNVSVEEVLARYGLVLHLEVVRDPEAYASFARHNPARSEDHAGARSLDRAIQRVYEAHKGYFHLTGSLEKKTEEACHLLRERCA